MPFAQGDIVSPLVVNATTQTSRVVPQPPHFGVVDDAADQNSLGVIWDDGRLQTGIDGATLDRLGTPDANEVSRLVGRVVRVRSGAAGSNSESSSYDALVVALYTRAPDSANASATLALVRTLAGGVYREVLSSTLIVPDGR